MTFVVVGNDAGGAELLCAFAAQHADQAQWHVFGKASSPMAAVAAKRGFTTTEPDDIERALDAIVPDALLFGTGWQERYERPFVAYAKSRGIPTFAFLDHWSHYRERFGYPDAGWEANLPDFTVVHDEKALVLAGEFGLPHPVALPNLYLREIVDAAHEQPVQSTLLFFGEPTDRVAKAHYGNKNYWGFTQYTALEAILENFERFGCESLSIRLHPSEKAAGYVKVLKKFPRIRVRINDAGIFSLTDQIMQAKVIIGFDTMALYIAAHLDKPVISFLPSPDREFLLPLPASRQIRDLSLVTPELLRPLHFECERFGMDFASFCQLIRTFPLSAR